MLRRTAVRCIPEFNFGHTSLKTAFAGAAPAAAAATPAPEGAVEITVCANGARVVTHQRGGAQSSIGAYVEAGAKFDPVAAPGLSSVFRWALTTSNMENSLFQIDRGVRSVGASMEHLEERKKYVGIRIDSRADVWAAPLADVFTCISAPRFHEADVERFRDTMDNQLEEQRWQQPRDYCIDKLEGLAFYKEPLGSPRNVPPTSNDACNHGRIFDHWAKHCRPSRVVVAGVNVDHQALVKAYDDAPYPHSATAPHHSRAETNFIDQKGEATTYAPGGEVSEEEGRAKAMGTKPDMDPETIVAIGYQCFGTDGPLKDYASSMVAQQAMNITINDAIRYEREDTHHGIRSFYRPYSTAGLLGFTARAAPSEINKNVVDGFAIVKQMGAASLSAAKSAAALAFYSKNLENNRDYCDFLGTSLAASGDGRVKPEQILAAIEAVTAADIKRVAAHATAARPCMFATGDTFRLPSLRQMGV